MTTLAQSFNTKSKGIGSILRKGEDIREEPDSFERDETQLNQQESETATAQLPQYGKQKSKTNLVAPFTPLSVPDDDTKVFSKAEWGKLGSRYKVADLVLGSREDLSDCGDFSRDEDIGIGAQDGVVFDAEDLFGNEADKKAVKRNRSKMLLDELEGGAGQETEQSFRQ